LNEQVQNAQSKFEQMQKEALEQEVRASVRGIKAGDNAGFTSLLDRFGGDTWHTVKANVTKAKELAAQKKLDESLSAWTIAMENFPAATQKMRAGFWLDKANLAAKMGAWKKVGVFADNVLLEDSENMRAKQLKSEAEKHPE